MRRLHIGSEKLRIIVIVGLVLIALATGLSAVAAQVPGTTPNLAEPGTATKAPNLQIVSPSNGQKLGVNFVNIRYQVTNPAAAVNNLPTFMVQLDGGDPVTTSSTEQTFTGLAPGPHTVIVELVDANSTPVAGTRTEVHFVVAPTVAVPGRTGASTSLAPRFERASRRSTETAEQDPATQGSPAQTPDNSNLPSSGSSLPLLSVIGFGVLVGGIASALKTR